MYTNNYFDIETFGRVTAWTRNSSGDEIANVNFLYHDIVHALQNTKGSCINSATHRRGYVLKCMFTKFSEITQCNGHYFVQGHSGSPILIPIESSYTLQTNDRHTTDRRTGGRRYTPWTVKKRGTVFLTITKTFLGLFLHFLQQMKQE